MLSGLRAQLLAWVLEGRIAQRLSERRLAAVRRQAARSTRAERFAATYSDGAWGGPSGGFYSGNGSDDSYGAPYVDALVGLLRERGATRVVDVGCGDFQVGARLVAAMPELTYTGVDIVPELVARNNAEFGSERVSFVHADAVTEPLPEGDACLVRQVLQHLSNDDIGAVLARVRAFPLVIVTEHLVAEDAVLTPNVDIPSGPATRIGIRSHVDLREEPFGCAVTPVLRVPYRAGQYLETVVAEP